jgi:hypothetical protein
MKLGRWICIAVAVAMLLGAASAQTGDYHVQLVTGSGSSDSGTTPSLTVKSGDTGTAVVNILPQDGFNQKVTLACVGVPSNGSCTFNPTSVTPNPDDSRTWTTTLTINTVANAIASKPNHGFRNWMLASFFAIAGVFAAGARRRRAFLTLVVLTVVFLLMSAACGGSSSTPSNQVQPGTYNIQVDTTSGSLTHSATLQLIVTRK